MNKKYAIDSSSLINATHHYNMNKRAFSGIWDILNNMLENEELISTIEVLNEIKDEELLEWLKRNRNSFIDLTQDIQEKTIDILKNFPEIIKLRSSSNSNADPFLIATAILHEAIVVSDEKYNSNKVNIPFVCKHYNIECINLNEFINRITT